MESVITEILQERIAPRKGRYGTPRGEAEDVRVSNPKIARPDQVALPEASPQKIN